MCDPWGSEKRAIRLEGFDAEDREQLIAPQDDLFATELIASLIDDRRFVPRQWLVDRVQEHLDGSEARFVLLTGEPGAGKSAVMAHLARLHPEAPRHFIRRDSIASLEGGDARTFLFALGHQLAHHHPSLFDPRRLEVVVRQRAERIASGGRMVGIEVKDLLVSPFHDTAIRVEQHAGVVEADLVGISANRMTLEPRLLELSNLQYLALLDPAEVLAEQELAARIVVLVDALDEIRYGLRGEDVLAWLTSCPELPPNVRFVLTSRPDPQLLSSFREVKGSEIVELSIDPDAEEDRDSIREDLHRFLDRFASEPAVAEAMVTHEVRPTSFVDGAADRAQGNFQYVVALARGIDAALGSEPPSDDLAALLRLEGIPAGTQELYRFFLGRIKEQAGWTASVPRGPADEPSREPAWTALYKPLLAVLAVAFEPLLPEQLLAYARVPADHLPIAIEHLDQFLDPLPDGRYRLYHATFPEFLTGEETRGAADPFHVDPATWHGLLAGRLLRANPEWLACEDDYALAHTPAHLMEAIALRSDDEDREELAGALTELLTDLQFLEQKTARLGADAALTDLLRAQGVHLSERDEVDEVTLVFSREMHNLRGWDPQTYPAQFTTQIRNRARGLGVSSLAERSDTVLRRMREPHLELLWRASAESPALERILVGHDGSVDTLDVTLDGRRLISGAQDGTLRVWDLPTGRQLMVLEDHPYGVSKVLASPDGLRAMSVSNDRAARIWDLASPRVLLTLQDINDIAMTPDGRFVIGFHSGGVQIRSAETAEPLSELRGRDRPANLVAVDPRGQWIAAGSAGGVVTLWNPETDQARELIAQAEVTAIALARDGGLLVTGSSTGSVEVWDHVNGGNTRTLGSHDEGVVGVVVTDDAHIAVTASNDGTMTSWDLATGDVLNSVRGDRNWLRGSGLPPVALTPDGRLAIGALSWQTLRIMETRKGGEVRRLRGHGYEIRATAVTPDGKLAISASGDHTVRVWNLESARLQPRLLGHPMSVEAVAVSADGDVVLSGSTDGTLKVWDVAAGEERFSVSGHDGSIDALALDRSGRTGVSGGSDSTARVWDLSQGKEIRAVELDYELPHCLGIADDGTVLMVMSSGTVATWDQMGIRVVWTGSERGGQVLPCAVADGGRVAILVEPATNTQNFAVIDLTTGSSERIAVDLHAQSVSTTPDGKMAAAGLGDGTIRVWAVKGMREICRLVGHRYLVTSIAITPDARRLVSGAGDRSLRVWEIDVPQQEEPRENQATAWVALDAEVSCVATSSDGRTIATGEESGAVSCFRFWGASSFEGRK